MALLATLSVVWADPELQALNVDASWRQRWVQHLLGTGLCHIPDVTSPRMPVTATSRKARSPALIDIQGHRADALASNAPSS